MVSAALLAAGAAAESPSAATSYLGIYTRSNANVLEQTNVIAGITVTRVVENSPGAVAGVETGDVLLEANGLALTHPNQLANLVEPLPVGSTVHLRLERDQTVRELEASTVARRIPVEPEGPSTRTWIERRRLGFEFASPDPESIAALGLGPRQGVEVRRIAARSPLLNAGVETGDLLWEVDGDPIHTPEDMLSFLESDPRRETLELTVHGRDGRRTTEVELFKPERRLKKLGIPLLFSMERDIDHSTYSAILGLFRFDFYETGTRVRLLWFFSWETGTWDELLEVGDS